MKRSFGIAILVSLGLLVTNVGEAAGRKRPRKVASVDAASLAGHARDFVDLVREEARRERQKGNPRAAQELESLARSFDR